MSLAVIAALFSTVVLLFITAYFILGSIPLLVLKHDTPRDARFVRSFFHMYYVVAVAAASIAAISYVAVGRLLLAAGAAALALLALGLRKMIIPRMDALGNRIRSRKADVISGFRKTHLTAIAINIVQLAVIVWALVTARL